MSETNVFGRIVTPGMVERAVVAALQKWMDTYLGELERLDGYAPGTIQRPLGIIRASEFEKWPEDQVPVIVVVNAGLSGKPERHAQGAFAVSWALGITAVVSDTDEASTRDLSQTYVSAIGLSILQHGRLKSAAFPNGLADWVDWTDEAYNDVPFLNSRSLAAGRCVIEVGVENARSMQAGPADPLASPSIDPGPWPNAQTPRTNVVPLTITETVT